VDKFNIATFALGVLGFGTGVASLTWNVVAFLLQGARPKLTPVIGLHYGGGLITSDATRDVRESLRSAVTQLPPGELVIGVKVVNAGRATFHVGGWAIRTDPGGVSFVPVDNPIGCPDIPCDIPPGAEKIFFTGLVHGRALVSASGAIDSRRQHLVATVSSGGRTYATKPVAHVNLALSGP
jgi:hypothetical protein